MTYIILGLWLLSGTLVGAQLVAYYRNPVPSNIVGLGVTIATWLVATILFSVHLILRDN